MVPIALKPFIDSCPIILYPEDARWKGSDNVDVACFVELDILKTAIYALRSFGEIDPVEFLPSGRIPEQEKVSARDILTAGIERCTCIDDQRSEVRVGIDRHAAHVEGGIVCIVISPVNNVQSRNCRMVIRT